MALSWEQEGAEIKRIAATLLLLSCALSACSRQNWYEGARSARQADCMQQPPAEYDDCMAAADESFSTYEKQRKSLP